MQEIKLNEKGEVVLYTDNGRMENGKITSEIKGNFNCDEVTAASLYMKGKGVSYMIDITSELFGFFRHEHKMLTDNKAYAEMVTSCQEAVKSFREENLDLHCKNEELKRKIKGYEKNWFVRLFLKRKED